MADRCAGCTNKFKFREKPTLCAKCRRNFCSTCIPPPSKHKKHSKERSSPVSPTRDTCVYCTRQLQDAMKAQEAEVLENFPERFHKSPHLVPQVQSRVQIDTDKLRATSHSGSERGGRHSPVVLSEEDRKLEERLRKLKESHKSNTPAYSEEELQSRLEKLRDDEPKPKPSPKENNSQLPPPSATSGDAASSYTSPSSGGESRQGGVGGESNRTDKTQAEQADNLLDQFADQVKLDSRLDETNRQRDKKLRSRFEELAGKKIDSDQPTLPQNEDLEGSISRFLSGLEVKIEDEDPDKLLKDFKIFYTKEEQAALSEATSADIQALVGKAKELHQEEVKEELGIGDEANIALISPYPSFPASEEMGKGECVGEGKVSGAEIYHVLAEAKKEMERDAHKREEMNTFVSVTSDRLGKLRGKEEEEEEEVVRSKLDPRRSHEQLGLDFAWGHFGSDGRPFLEASEGSRGETAAYQLGITLSGDSLGREVDEDEVQDLIKRMTAEAVLDHKLEEKGLDHYLSPPSNNIGGGGGGGGGVVGGGGGGGANAHSREEVKSQGGGATGSGSASAGATSSATAGWVWGGGDDLPWCCICNSDAQIRCYDCDDDLYCMQCFSEGHEQFGMFDHKYAPFEPPSGGGAV